MNKDTFTLPAPVAQAIAALLKDGLDENFVPMKLEFKDDMGSVVESEVDAYKCVTVLGNEFYYLVDSHKIRAGGKHTVVLGPRLPMNRVTDFFSMMVDMVLIGFKSDFIKDIIKTRDWTRGLQMKKFVDMFWNMVKKELPNADLGGATLDA